MKNLNLTVEMLAKAKTAANADELLTLAKAAGLDLTAQEAQAYFKALHNEKQVELNEADLDKVAGGAFLDEPDSSSDDDGVC